MSKDGIGERLRDVYRRLDAAYGPQHWWPGETPFEVIVGAILTQSAAWANVEKAIVNLKAAGTLTPQTMSAIDEAELAQLVYPAGYFNAKARKLRAFLALLNQRFDGDLERLLATPPDELRTLLLATHGIGPETADSILLYAAGQPSFVIDAYTRRTFARLGFSPARDDYASWRALFQEALPEDVPLFNQFHALIVHHGKDVCRAKPLCSECPLAEICIWQRQPR
ncbi:MAG TPA: endonuclease III domain-containing protein [Dehalococcoidia bacterium]|nr:endonuclease III domain-containing protein [Dehalococcoidia bacterium]